MSVMTIATTGTPERIEYDENDPAAVKAMSARFDSLMASTKGLGYVTRDGESEQIRKGEFPQGEAEVMVSRQYVGG